MKNLLWILSLLAGTAEAGALNLLSNPAMPPVANIHWMHCASIGFNPDGSIFGACQVAYGSCSGRYCHTPSIWYLVRWDPTGESPVLGAQCASVAAGTGATPVLYVAPYASASCAVSYDPTGSTVGIPYGPYSWQVTYYYYVTTNATTGAELVDSNSWSYLWTP